MAQTELSIAGKGPKEQKVGCYATTVVFSINITDVDVRWAHRSFDSGEYPAAHPRGALLKLGLLEIMDRVTPGRF